MDDLIEKLSPDKIKCSGRFTAMLAFILGEHEWSDPEITGMVVTSDGMLLVESTRDPFANEFIGDVADLWKNLRGVAKAAGLTAHETKTFLTLAQQKVRHA